MGKDKTGKVKMQPRKLRDLPAKAKQATAVKGGNKHIAGVKYEDITI